MSMILSISLKARLAPVNEHDSSQGKLRHVGK